MKGDKIRSLATMKKKREELRASGQKLVFTNGCFDLLHLGHVRYLREARALGDRLLVAVNADRAVARLKGKNRPLVPLEERMEILAALEAVDYVIPFDEDTPAEVIRELTPDVLVKGGDWTHDRIVGKDIVEAAGGKVLALPFQTGYSTSEMIARIVHHLGKGGEEEQ
ncbi:MAG: D-glycero-beta-D-manno-heptose 1-phosphate adenylyltransferase [Acidobacteriota bacterium]